MTGIYLKCEKCQGTFGGEEATRLDPARYPYGLHWSQTQELEDAARKIGWTGDLTRESNNDLCPKCSE